MGSIFIFTSAIWPIHAGATWIDRDLDHFVNAFHFLGDQAHALPLVQVGRQRDPAIRGDRGFAEDIGHHIGHVRNSVIGDTFVRILQADGNRVEVQYGLCRG